MQDQLLQQFLLATDDLMKGLLLLTHKGLEGQTIYRRQKARRQMTDGGGQMVNSGILEEWNDVFEIDK